MRKEKYLYFIVNRAAANSNIIHFKCGYSTNIEDTQKRYIANVNSIIDYVCYSDVLNYDNTEHQNLYENCNLETAVRNKIKEKGFSTINNSNETFEYEDTNTDFDVIKIIKSSIEEVVKVKIVTKKELIYLPHQTKIITQINNKKFCDIKSDYNRILLALKPRSGKTYITIGLLDSLLKNAKKNLGEYPPILFMTSYPILSGQQKEEISNYLYCKVYKSYNYNNSDNILPKPSYELPEIYFISNQDVVRTPTEIEDKKKFENLKNVKWLCVVTDEVHHGTITEKRENFIKNISYYKRIDLSATPSKNIYNKQYSSEEIYFYTLVDEFNNKKKYPTKYNIPNINWMIWSILEQNKDKLGFYSKEEQFTFTKLFRVDENKNFLYKEDVEYVFKLICGNIKDNNKDVIGTKTDYPLLQRGIFNNIEGILFFLPAVNCLEPLANLLKRIPYYNNNFNIQYTHSKESYATGEKLLVKLKEWDPAKEHNNGKRTIILVVDQLTTGITIPYIDMCIHMDDISSFDIYQQRSYRSQNFRLAKTECYNIDLNPTRCLKQLSNLYDYNKNIKSKNNVPFLIKDWFDCVSIHNREIGGKFKPISFDYFQDYYNELRAFTPNKNTRILDGIINNIDFSKYSFINSLKFVKGNNNIKIDKIGNSEAGKNYTSQINNNFKNKKISDEDRIKEKAKELINQSAAFSIVTNFKFDKITDCFEYIQNNEHFLEKLFLFPVFNNIGDIIKTNINFLLDFYIKVNSFSNYIDDKLEIFNNKINSELNNIKEGKHNDRMLGSIENVCNIINEYLRPSKYEVKKHAEVFTPFSLINQMLDKLPEEVWTNPNLKWLDPANGIGNFPAVIIKRLMNGLEGHFSDEKERYKHIIENMIYVCDIQPKNMWLYQMIFNTNNEYKLNVFKGSYLDEEFDKYMLNDWGIDKFDIIVGNPPYQNTTGNKGVGHSLWDKFVEKDVNLLKKNGYLVQIHPSKWRQLNHKFKQFLLQNQILYLEIHDEKDGDRFFKSATRFDWYVLQKIPYYTETVIRDQIGNLFKENLKEWTFIPNFNFELIKRITNSKNKITLLHSESAYEPRKNWMSKNKTETNIYPCIYSINKKNSPTFCWSSDNLKGMFGVSKVIFAGGSTGFILDIKGEYGLTQWASGIVDKDENLIEIYKVISSIKFWDQIVRAVSVNKQEINWKMIKEFNKDFYKTLQQEI